MKYTVTSQSCFSAAHFLRNYNGSCENIHGHNWKIEVSVSSSTLDEQGFVIDFLKLCDHIEEAKAKFDHTNINDVPPFDKVNPTAENICKHLYEMIDEKVKDLREDAYVSGIKVWELENCFAQITV